MTKAPYTLGEPEIINGDTVRVRRYAVNTKIEVGSIDYSIEDLKRSLEYWRLAPWAASSEHIVKMRAAYDALREGDHEVGAGRELIEAPLTIGRVAYEAFDAFVISPMLSAHGDTHVPWIKLRDELKDQWEQVAGAVAAHIAEVEDADDD